MAEVEVRTNLPELKAHLDRIGKQFASRVMRSATAAAARIFRKYAQQYAPVLKAANRRKDRVPGQLKKNIFVRRSKDSTTGREHYFVGFRSGKSAVRKGRDAFYGRFLEGGWIAKGPGKRLRGRRRAGDAAKAGGGKTKYQYPFLAPAFTRGKNEALQKFYSTADRRIEQISRERTPR